ncbi:hypothetical protein [Mesorhizobium sp. M0058]|uniref:hypothetical protein n=1 Tax=Mesorhizobium sp. M0058 TaxID=2956865 RepID=UPI0033351456
MKLQKLAGATSEIWQIFIRDSSSTTGGGLTGLTNASGSLTAYYHRDTDTTATAISLVTMTVGTFTSSGFKEIDATNMPGWYQFCPPNAALAAGAKSCAIHLKGAANMAPMPIEVQLIAVNIDDAVRMGMTALPNAAAGANGGLPLSVDASGRVDVLKINGTSQTARDIGASVLLAADQAVNATKWAGGTIPAPNVTGVPLVDDKYLLGTIYSTPATAGIQDINVINWKGSAAAAMTGDAYARLGAPAGASVSADVAAVKVDTSAIKVTTDKVTFTVANQVDVNVLDWKGAAAPAMTGDAFARLGAPAGASVSADVAAVKAVLPAALVSGRIDASVGAMAAAVLTATAIAADAITDAKVAGDVTIASVTGAVGSVTGAVGSVTGNVGGNVTGSVGSVAAGGITASSFAADSITAAKLAADVTTELQAGLATAASVAALNNLSAAQVNAEVDTAIADAALATAANLAVVAGYIDTEIGTIITNLATVDTVVDAIKVSTDKLDDTVEDDGGTYRFTANALEQAPTGGSAPTASAIADEVQTRTIAAVTTVNGLAANSVTAAALAADAGTEIGTAVWATTTRLLTAGTNIALAKGTGVTGFNDLSAAQVNAEADAALADVGVTSTVTGRIDAAVSTRSTYAGGDTAGTTTLLSRLGAPVGATISADIAAIKAIDDAVKAKTDNLPSDPADQSLIIDATTAIMSRLGAPAGASLSADIAARSSQTSVDDLPTNAELAAGFAGADDAVLAAIAALTVPTAAANAAALLATAFEGAETVQDFLRLSRAALYGKADGLDGSTVHYRDAADAKDRLTAEVDEDGNRLVVTTDAT